MSIVDQGAAKEAFTLFEKDYDGESLYDIGRDVCEALETAYNPLVGKIPTDQYGFQTGTFRVKVEWVPE